MGEHAVLGQPNGLLPNGLLPNQVSNVTRALDMERWSKAEKRTAELIACIQPNQPSEEHRNAVASYVCRLIMKCFSCRVFTFGSVPLKTYLPDGDIDLTACSNNEDLKDSWANAVREVLENEEKIENAEFCVKEVQYIQAEVKLIKCLVDNIVVDVSFNQVGGLCTLCYLEEVDDLINQNHLLKRSLILIKSWCYYESRILGAHHGLISTYALETLVLYMFHVYNSSFAGPLEVLYRFLEFFSNFDWDNFCVSLWGPIPISSLPDMFAEQPRKDSGKVFFSEDFLHGCSKKYGVIIPRDQENQAQPFVSKHFNVVDPLRTNNNLGRSVSKGNFFRIRTAFAFGAKRLARLLKCPMEDIIAEVNQFFMNTWQRHGNGPCANVPILDLRHLQVLKNVPKETNNSKNTTNAKKKIENVGMHAGHESDLGAGGDSRELLPGIDSTIDQNSKRINGISNYNKSLVSRCRGQKYYGGQINSRVSDQFERNNSYSGSVHTDKSQKMFKSNYSLEEERQGRLQFTRVRSSPELVEAALDLSRGRHDSKMETRKTQDAPADTGYNIRSSSGSEATGSQISNVDPLPMRQSSSDKNLEVVCDSNSASNNFHGDFNFGTLREELASVSERMEMQQEEQDLINMMESSDIHSFNGQVQLPMYLSSHFPLTLSPVPSSFDISQRNWAGVFPANPPLIGPSWGSSMQFHPGSVAAPLSHYFRDATFGSNGNDAVEFDNEGPLITELNSEEFGFIYQESDAGASRRFNSDDSGHHMFHSDSKQRKPHYGLNPVRTSRNINSGALSIEKSKFTREVRGLVREDENDTFQNSKPKSKVSDHNSNSRGANKRFENFSYGFMEKVPRSASDKWERKPVFSPTFSSLSGKAINGSQSKSSSNHVQPVVDDGISNWTSMSPEATDGSERITGSSMLSSGNTRNQPLNEFEPARVTGSDQLLQFAPVLVDTSQQSRGDNAKGLPLAFVPTGPPFPFVMVPVPVYKSISQLERDDEVSHCGAKSDLNIDLVESSDHSKDFLNSAASRVPGPESFDELHKSDILNSDRNSHWQNLEYGRLCQNSHYHAPLVYSSSPLMVPPQYSQGPYPWDGPARSMSANLNLMQVMGYGPSLVPMIPLHPGPDRASGSFQHSGDEAPRYRGGTGTYLPNPKFSHRERQSSSRHHRGNHSRDRHDHRDREGSWISSKHSLRNGAERPRAQPDQHATTKNHVDTQWDSYRHVPASYYMVQNSSFGSSNSSHGRGTVVGTYTQSALGSDAGGPTRPEIPPFLMVYPYDEGVSDVSSVEPLEFGSLGPVHHPENHVAHHPSDGVPASGTYEQRHGGTYRVGSWQSSPDQPSSPQLKR
ncbi:uncharacterized protein LOC103973606 isoform X1 [Musa acuminata AAA Group]|uniref:uncharacterized protein LOC103973606 isoform X1 n=2 Tax=Musa acuminata AAA Group TaxID=214697 RepID=UPI0031CE7E05